MVYYPQESLYKPYKYHGYTVRGTPNCPLIHDGLATQVYLGNAGNGFSEFNPNSSSLIASTFFWYIYRH